VEPRTLYLKKGGRPDKFKRGSIDGGCTKEKRTVNIRIPERRECSPPRSIRGWGALRIFDVFLNGWSSAETGLGIVEASRQSFGKKRTQTRKKNALI